MPQAVDATEGESNQAFDSLSPAAYRARLELQRNSKDPLERFAALKRIHQFATDNSSQENWEWALERFSESCWDECETIAVAAVAGTFCSVQMLYRAVVTSEASDVDQYGFFHLHPADVSLAMMELSYADLLDEHSRLLNQIGDGGRNDLKVAIAQLLLHKGLRGDRSIDQVVEAFCKLPIDNDPKAFEIMSAAVETFKKKYGSPDAATSPIDGEFGGITTAVLDAGAELPIFRGDDYTQKFQFVLDIVSAHGRRIRAVADRFPTLSDQQVLTLFGANIDTLIKVTAEQGARFLDLATRDMRADELDQVVTVAKATEPPKVITSKAELVGMVMRRMLEASGEKVPMARDAESLEGWLDDIAREATLKTEVRPGGAAANMALYGHDSPVTMYSPGISKELATLFGDSAVTVLQFLQGDAAILPIHRIENSGNTVSNNRCVEIDGRMPFTLGTISGITQKSSRLIFSASTNSVPIPPILPASASYEMLSSLGARFHHVVYNNLHYLTEADFEIFKQQIAALKEGGATIHGELSRSPGLYVKNAIDNRSGFGLHSLGLSDEQIPEMIDWIREHVDGSVPSCSKVQLRNEPFQGYLAAAAISKAFGLDRVYIHAGNVINLDLVIRTDLHQEPETANAQLQHELLGGLRTKIVSAGKLRDGSFDSARYIFENPKPESMVELFRMAQQLHRSAILRGDSIDEFLRTGIFGGAPDFPPAIFIPQKWFVSMPLHVTGAGDTSMINSVIHCGMGRSLQQLTEVVNLFREHLS